MSLPSDSRAVETFWQQLMLSLAPASGEGFRLATAGSTAAVNRLTSVRLLGAGSEGSPEITAISPSGECHALSAVPLSEGFQATFTPDVAGRWQLKAKDATGAQAFITLPVTLEVRTHETSNVPADVDGLRRISEATGGALLTQAFVFQVQASGGVDAQESRIVQPLWNQQWLLATFLGIYVVELTLRRACRLL